MNIFKNDAFKMILALALVGIFSGVSLVFVYNYSVPKIKVNMDNETKKAIQNIFPSSKEVKTIEKDKVFEVQDGTGKSIGYAFIASGNGYQGEIRILSGTDITTTKMKGMQVLSSQETPGLGAEIMNAPFKDQFNGLALSHAIEYVKNEKPDEPYEIEAITGATISSRSVVNILNKGVEELRRSVGKGK